MDARERLIESGLALSRELSLEVVLRRIIELGVEITGARYGALGVLKPGGSRLVRFITVGLTPEEEEAIGAPPVGRGLLGVLIEEPSSLRVAKIGDHPRSAGFPPNHPPMTSMLGIPVISRGVVLGDLYLTNKIEADSFTEEDEAAVTVLASQAAVAIENARLYEAARGRAELLEALQAIAATILSGADRDDAIAAITERAARLVGAEAAMVVLDPGEAIVPPDGVPSAVVPLSVGDRTRGSLAAIRALGGEPFSAADIALLSSFAGQASIALAYAQAQEEARRALVLDDRERIAKELHDGVIQALFAVGMGLQGTALLTAEPELAARIEGSVAEIDRAIRDLRNYIFGLRPGALADRQLDEALRSLTGEFEQRTGVLAVADIDSHAAAELSPHAMDILQFVREALSNVGRHAEATTCRVTLTRDGSGAILEVDDDGKGFDSGSPTHGMGLPNLRERARALGGELTVDAAPGRGTLVRVAFPI